MDVNMCDKELLVGYLYDEIDTASRRAIEAHLASCAACRGEVGALRATRRELATWTPPERQLGFQIVSGAARPPASRFRLSPVWGLAAAAVLVLAAAAAVANVEVRYGADGMIIRTGWGRAPATQIAEHQPSAIVPAAFAATLEAIDQRLRELETAAPQAQGVVTQASSGSRISDAEVLRRVRALLTDSEARQNRELALRIRQLATEIQAQRRLDLATLQQGLQGDEAASHRELLNYVNNIYRVSLQSK